MKKLQFKIRRALLHPWILRNKPECTLVLRDAIVYQMWAAGIAYPTINKWLALMKMPTIKCYTMTKNGPRLYYRVLSSEERREIGTQVVNIG